MIISEADYLVHYGVKGMRWGVRKKMYKDATKNYAQVSEEVHRRQTERRGQAALNEAKYKKLDNKDVIIKRGSTLKRVTKDAQDDSKHNTLYVSINEKDAEFYRATLPTERTGGIPAKNHKGYYESTLLAVEDLKSPSEKKRVDAYVRLMDKPAIELNDGQVVTGRDYLRQQGLGHTVDSFASRQLALTYYGQLVANQGVRNDPINTAVFKDLSKRGYNAIIDDNDRGVLTRQPLLALNAMKSLQTIEVKGLTTEEIHKAQARIKLPDT
jgi:hypothetical protein